jgi:uncharacterized linocin/CFP29 family protein
MNHLHQELAPVTDEAWKAIEEEAAATLRAQLTGRRVVEVDGPHGWEHAGVPTGRVRGLADLPDGSAAGRAFLRKVQPLVEVRVPFALAREVVDAIARGDEAPGLSPVADAARAVTHAENRAIFHGWEKAGIEGILTASPHEPIPLSGDFIDFPAAVTRGVEALRVAGVEGPYAIVLGTRSHSGLTGTTGEGGYPIVEHVRRLVDGPVLWTPALDGAVILSGRGGDFEMTLGQDVSLGYLGHDAGGVQLYLEESFTFRPLGSEAAVGLVYER